MSLFTIIIDAQMLQKYYADGKERTQAMTSKYLHENKSVNYARLGSGSDGVSERLMKLEYYLTETETIWDEGASGDGEVARAYIIAYGLGVKKIESGEVEENFIDNVTCDQRKARRILTLLADNFVTPCCFTEVLEDMAAQDFGAVLG